MGKNYKIIYQRLVKEIKDELEALPNYPFHHTHNERLLEEIELNTQISMLEWIVSMLPEIEGKQCNMVMMNREEFKKWKKKIKN